MVERTTATNGITDTMRYLPFLLTSILVITPSISGSAEDPLFSRLPASATQIDFVHFWAPPEKHAAQLTTAFSGAGVAIGDFNGDNLPDIFVTRPTDQGQLYQNLGDFRFKNVTASSGIAIPDRPMWSTGASFADIDNDGDLDLSVCGFDCPNRIYLNNNDGTFTEVGASLGLDYSGASITMAFADIDNDGDLDAYLLTNRLIPDDLAAVPASAFSLVDGEPVVAEPYRELVKGIKKRDGTIKWVDAAQYDYLFRNDGPDSSGKVRFKNITSVSGMTGSNFGLSAVWWDYNSDGLPDLYVSNDFFGPDQLYRNNGPDAGAHFTEVVAETMPYTPWFSMGADVGDLNNDGFPDLIATDMAGSNHYRDKLGMGNMSGPNSDGWFLNFPNPPQYMRNTLFLNSNSSRFNEAAFQAGIANTDWTWTPKIADFNNDGREDIFFTNGMSRDYLNSDLRAKFLASFKGSPMEMAKSRHEFWFKQAKLDQPNRTFKNTGSAKFTDVSADWGLDHSGVGYGAATGDLDLDGDLDLVVLHFDEPLHVYENNSNGSANFLNLRLVGTRSNRFGIGARVTLESSKAPFRQSRNLTLSRGYMSSDNPVIHFGLGSQAVIEKLIIRWPSGIVQELTNLKPNQLLTVVEKGSSFVAGSNATKPLFESLSLFDGISMAEEDFDDFARQPLLPNQHSRLGPGIAFADLNEDSHPEFYLGRSKGETGRLCLNKPGFSPTAPRRLSSFPSRPFLGDSGSEDMAPLFFDADGDGDLDLYVVSGSVECEPGDPSLRDRLYLNVTEPGDPGRKPEFVKAPDDALPNLRDSGSTVVAADFDRDGDLDLFVGSRIVPGRYPESPKSRLLENQTTTKGDKTIVRFVEVTEKVAPSLLSAGLVTAAVWSDANNDGWLDLLITTEWGPVRFLENQKGQLVDSTAKSGLDKRLGWYNSIAAGDFDHDGDVDFAVGNFGLNTKYGSPSFSKPQLLYYGDFDGNGKSNIVEAKYELQPDGTKRCLPMRGLGCSSDAMPWVRKKLPTFHQFAISELQQIYPKDRLSDAKPFKVTSLESGLLINDGKGVFSFQPLPDEAQVAPVHGLVLRDFNGDSHLDLFLLHNFYTPQRETGRMSGGLSLLLHGTGDGSFKPVPSHQSGLVIPGDARSLAAVHLNNDDLVDLVATTNEGPIHAFINKSPTKGSKTLTVKIKGKDSNPNAVGAKITLKHQGKTVRSQEIYAGSGYLSQGNSTQRLTYHFPPDAENLPDTLEARWPDGASSSIPLDDLSSIELTQP
jgi:hypothetical protein